jgi:hypothetical protein
MITPDPVLMTNESGRTFEFELGRMEKGRDNGQASLGTLSQENHDGNGTSEEDAPKWI